jgi:prepilin-type N-terminal cleavage/methylation domain-containing protein
MSGGSETPRPTAHLSETGHGRRRMRGAAGKACSPGKDARRGFNAPVRIRSSVASGTTNNINNRQRSRREKNHPATQLERKTKGQNMKTQTNTNLNRSVRGKTTRGFTLLEMIGVLAVIAILAAFLLPRVFAAINSARINDAAVGCNTVKTAAIDHYAKYGKLATLNGTTDLALPITNFCMQVLMPEQLLDKPFSAKIGGGDASTNSFVRLIAANSSGYNSAGYNLSGGVTNDVNSAAQQVLEAVIGGVALQDAADLSARLDGAALSQTTLDVSDTAGRVEYAYTSGNTTTTVYIYLTHR